MITSHLFDIEIYFKNCLASVNHPLTGSIQFDTSDWQRYACPESKVSKSSTRYRAHSDNTPMLKFQCKRCGINHNFPYKGQALDNFTQEQRTEMQERTNKRKVEQLKKIESARTNALIEIHHILGNAKPCLYHAYFDRKGLIITESDGLYVDNQGRVLCPVRLISGDLVSLQTIPNHGNKLFHKNTSPKNGFHIFGSIKNHNEVFFAEGIATALTIYQATNKPVICVYGKHFHDIAPIIKNAYPNKKFIYCCDKPSEKEQYSSERSARKAISLIGGHISLPDFSMISIGTKSDINLTDFNDLFVDLLANGLERTAALETVRQQIQQNLDEGIMAEATRYTKPINTEKADKPKKSELLLALIDLGGFEFFHDEQEVTYCRFTSSKSNAMETRRIIDRDFKNYLTLIFRRNFETTIGDTSLREVLSELEGRALFDGPKEKVYLRTGEHNGKFYIDLCNSAWQAVEISADGWKVLESQDIPIRFKRTPHMKPLPIPTENKKGAASLLFKSLNIPTKDRILVLANIIDAFRCTTNYTILTIVGLQGSGKSFNQEVIRQFTDPNICNSRTAPRKNEDMVIDASTNHVVSYGNVSFLSTEAQDDLCNMSTGGGFARRTLFVTSEQTVSDICKPVMINGITNPLTRPDALDRAIIIELDIINESKRKTEEELKREIQKKSRLIFTGLLNLFSKALKKLPEVTLQKKPRMADFALLGCAIEKAYGLTEGLFISKYLKNRKEAQENVLDAAPVVQALVDFINICPNGFWRGTPSNLLKILNERETPSINMTWPKSGRGMSEALKRYIYPLKQVGINVFPEPKRSENGFCYQISKITTQTREESKTNTASTGSTAYKLEHNNIGVYKDEHDAEHVNQSTAEAQEVQPKFSSKYSHTSPRGVYVPEGFDANSVLPVLKNSPSRSYGSNEIDDSEASILIQ